MGNLDLCFSINFTHMGDMCIIFINSISDVRGQCLYYFPLKDNSLGFLRWGGHSIVFLTTLLAMLVPCTTLEPYTLYAWPWKQVFGVSKTCTQTRTSMKHGKGVMWFEVVVYRWFALGCLSWSICNIDPYVTNCINVMYVVSCWKLPYVFIN